MIYLYLSPLSLSTYIQWLAVRGSWKDVTPPRPTFKEPSPICAIDCRKIFPTTAVSVN